MKWLKFKNAYQANKDQKFAAGEIVDWQDDSTAGVLVKTGVAEETTEPKEVTAGADALSKSLAELQSKLYTDSIDRAMVKVAEEIGRMNKGGKSKRPMIGRIHDNIEDDPRRGFKSSTDFTLAVKKFYSSGMNTDDDRMKSLMGAQTKAPTTYSSEGFGADGGFLLPPEFLQELYEWVFDDEALMSRCDMLTTASNNLTIPKDETTPWGSVGVRGFWTAEAAQATQTKPQLGQDQLQLQKYTALVPVTDEMLQDSFTSLGPYITRKAGANIRFYVDEAIINGTGAGQPLGILNSPSVVTATVPSTQVGTGTPTILLPNIAQMISRIPSQSLSKLVWLIHPSAYPQIRRSGECEQLAVYRAG